MKKSVLEIYALAVCFVSVICFVCALGIAAYGLLSIVKPDFTMNSWQYEKHQSNDAFWNDSEAQRHSRSDGKQKEERPGQEELSKQRAESFARALASEQRSGAQTLVKCLIVLLIDAAVFALHWLIARRARASAA